MRRINLMIIIAFLGVFQLGFLSIPQQKNQVVRVGAYENAPKIYADGNGEMAGFWPDLINAIAAKEGWQIVWIHGTWDELLTKLTNNEIDILPDTAWTQVRSQMFTFNNRICPE